MRGTLEYLLYACGKKGPPGQIVFGGDTYRLHAVLKHDFFAATALYQRPDQPLNDKTAPTKIILKLGRQQHLFGVPLAWLGELLCSHEVAILSRLSSVRGIPCPLARYGKTGFIYEYIEGRPLREQKQLPPDFFNQLLELLSSIHQRNVVYLDMNKADNILLGADGKPHLIDFQISLHIGDYFLLSKHVTEHLRQMFQWADVYHLFKHKRRLCPRFLWPHEKAVSRDVSPWIQAHRRIANPLRRLRRNLLKLLYAKGALAVKENRPYSHEDDPARFRS